MRVTLHKGIDHNLVFVAFDRARRIDKLAAGFQDSGGVFKEEFLLGGEGGDVVFGDAVADLWVATQGAGAGAWRVDEDAIEGAGFEG